MDDVLMNWSPVVPHFHDGMEFELHVNVKVVRYQTNIPHFFSITCMEYPLINGERVYGKCERSLDCFCHGGCDHEYIGKFFPELIPYFDLHLKSRFGDVTFSKERKISDPFYTEDDKQTIYNVERRVRARKYLHARELINLIRQKSQQP
jgi:hypothetical protein